MMRIANVCAAKRLAMGVLLPTSPYNPSLFYMLESAAAVFERDINQNQQLLPGIEVSVRSASAGNTEPHIALGAATRLYSEADKGTLVGWVGPFAEESCKTTHDLIRGLGQPQISYGCTSAALSSRRRFPVR